MDNRKLTVVLVPNECDGRVTRQRKDSVTLPNGVILGEIPGVPVGSTFESRKELHDRNVHRGLIQGIAVGGSSVVLNGGYEDDEDLGDVIIYTGQGGRDPNTGKQIRDQELSLGNRALAANSDRGVPVRLIRGPEGDRKFSPVAGYRFDGLYRIDSYWAERGKDHGYRIGRFRLIQLTSKDSELVDGADSATGKPSRKDVIVSRIIRSSDVGEGVKTIHGNRCQVCGTAVKTKTGTYAECCHIKPLGQPHGGLDVLGNVLCLCPNCHVAFDRFGFTISDDFIISTTGERLRIARAHTINKEFLAYHRSLSGSST